LIKSKSSSRVMNNPIFIEKIASEDILRNNATTEDITFVEQFSNAKRRCEVLAWRAIVRRELGAKAVIFYDEYGAPKVDNPNKYISVSHSKEYVAVYIADGPCAIDIESANRDFCRVASRYLSIQEQQIAKEYDIFAEMWSAKEALYKYYKKGNLDLVRDISIIDYNRIASQLVASILGSLPIVVNLGRCGNLVVATIG